MDDPGRMSWNWCVRRMRHAASRVSCSYSPPWSIAHAESSSARCSSPSHFRLLRFVRPWVVWQPRCSSRYSSPFHTGSAASGAEARIRSKQSSVRPKSQRGTPVMFFSRRPYSSMRGDGPPPPADFGVLVTRQTIGRHLEAERRELADYVQAHGLK